MGKSGRYDGLKPAGFKSASSWANQGGDWDQKTQSTISGICIGCRQWSAELFDRYCSDETCKRERQEVAIAQGRAVKIVEGLPNGETVVKTAKGNVVVKGNK